MKSYKDRYKELLKKHNEMAQKYSDILHAIQFKAQQDGVFKAMIDQVFNKEKTK